MCKVCLIFCLVLAVQEASERCGPRWQNIWYLYRIDRIEIWRRLIAWSVEKSGSTQRCWEQLFAPDCWQPADFLCSLDTWLIRAKKMPLMNYRANIFQWPQRSGVIYSQIYIYIIIYIYIFPDQTLLKLLPRAVTPVFSIYKYGLT